MVLKNGLSRMQGDLLVRFLGGHGAAMRHGYPTAPAILLPLMSRAARGNRQNIVLADRATISPLPAHSARDVTAASLATARRSIVIRNG